MQEKIAKLNSTNIKTHPQPAGTRVCARTLVMHIRTYGSTVPVFQKRFSCCILPREHDIGDSSLSSGDSGAPNCMENVMAFDTSLYFEGLHVTNWSHSIDTCTVHTKGLAPAPHADAYVIAITYVICVEDRNRQI